ncbi:MAG: ABC transporter substrate-binding protein [Chloroflexota bacterium]|nr:ABC transporter substrate-binding protein [Chloroflexota bacterium]
MGRLDAVISDLTSSRSNRRSMMKRAAALGLAVPAMGSTRLLSASAQETKNSVHWMSPRATLEVLDDYPYWVAKRFGYFGDIETVIDPAILEATSSTKAVAEGQGDMAYPSPGVFSLGLEQGIDLVTVFQMGAYDVFDIAVPKGNPGGIQSAADLEGKTVLLGDIGWSGIVDPMVAQAGGDPSTVNYVAAGTSWAQALSEGQGDAALSWAGLRAQWLATGLDFDYVLGKSWSKFPANSFVIRRSDFEDASLADLYTRYLRGWAMGLEFGHQNPRAATQITMEAEEISAALNDTFPDKAVAVQSMWQLADVFRGDFPNRNGGQWGWHSMESWKIFLDTATEIGQLQETWDPAELIFNDYIDGANDFDKAQVKADADGFELSEEFAAVEVPAGAGSDGAYPS